MEMVLKKLEGVFPLLKQGDMVKLTRWFSLWNVYEEKLRCHASFILMVLCYIGFHKGWLLSDDTVALMMMGDLAPLQATSTSPLQSNVVDSRSVQKSNEVLKHLRSKCSSTEHTVALILSNRFGKRVMDALSCMIGIVRKHHGIALTRAETPRGCSFLRKWVARGGWQEELQEIVLETVKVDALLKMSFLSAEDYGVATAEKKEEEQKLGQTLLDFICNLLESRIHYTCGLQYSLPWAAAGLLETEAVELTKQLGKFQRWWLGLEQLQKDKKVFMAAKEFSMDLVFTEWPWTAVLFLELAERGFRGISPQRRQALEKWSKSWLTTKLNEDAIRHCKMKMRQADNGQLSRLSRWGALSQSHLLSECAREEVIIEPCDSQAMAGKQLPADMFSADATPLSLDQQHFDTIMKEEKQKTYPHISPEKYHSCGLRWEAYLMSGSFQDLQRSWPTIFCPRAHSCQRWKGAEESY